MIAGILLAAAMGAQEPPKAKAAAPEPDPPKPKAAEKQLNSFERQRLSVERQQQTIRDHFPPPFAGSSGPVTAAPPPGCPPVTPAEVKPIIYREAGRQNLDARLVQAVVETESAYSPCAVSPAGALGLMQLMPSTAESLQVTDAFDPTQNITAGTQFLRQLMDRYGGDLVKALAAYNAGPAKVDAAGGIPPIPETQEYVRKILGKIALPRPIVE